MLVQAVIRWMRQLPGMIRGLRAPRSDTPPKDRKVDTRAEFWDAFREGQREAEERSAPRDASSLEPPIGGPSAQER